MSTKLRTVFLSVSAQPDNLGDIAIRQAGIDLVGGLPIVAYAGGMPASYLNAIDFPPGTRVTTSPFAFVGSLIRAVLGRRAHLMLAPGPHALTKGVGHFKALATLMAAVGVRASGGSVLAVGQSIRGTGAIGQRLQFAIARQCAVFAARDLLSSQVLDAPVDRCPDLALGISREARDGNRVVLSFRGDRHLDDDWMGELVKRLRDDSLDPVFVTQVKRDDAQHRRWAALLSVDLVAWNDRAHREQMTRVQAAMAESVSVVSDRLHAVIFGLQVGATPVVVLRNEPDKVVTTLADLVPLQLIDPSQPLGPYLNWRAAGELRSELDLALASARRDLDELGARICAAIGNEGNEYMHGSGPDYLTKDHP